MANGVLLTPPSLVNVRKLGKSAEVEAAIRDAPTSQAMDEMRIVPDFDQANLSSSMVGPGTGVTEPN
jgi:hypothetical protein